MTLTLVDDVIRLSGRCAVEEAEQLLTLLGEKGRRVDLSDCEHMHAAIFQILMAARAELVGKPGGFLGERLLPLLSHCEATGVKELEV